MPSIEQLRASANQCERCWPGEVVCNRNFEKHNIGQLDGLFLIVEARLPLPGLFLVEVAFLSLQASAITGH